MAKKIEEVESGAVAPLVAMTKDGETSEVHPSAVQAHQKAGWKVVSAEQLADATSAMVAIASADFESAELVKMVKDGVKAEVHPSTVKAHEKAGWKIA